MGFVSSPSRNTYVLAHSRLDGSDLQVVKTFTDDFPQHARWSPDGQRVAFFSNKGGDSRNGAGIRVIHTDGSNERHVGVGALGSGMTSWHATRHELTFCPQNFASISMLGNDGVGVFDGYTMAVNTDTGAVTARPQVDPIPPVFVGGTGRESVKCWMPLWVGDTLLVNRDVTEMTQGRLLSAPGVVPGRYEIAQRFLPITVTQHLVSGGTYNPGVPNTLTWGAAYLLDVNPVTLEVMVWMPDDPASSRTAGRLVLMLSNGRTQTLFRSPDNWATTDPGMLAGWVRFKWLPGCKQCLWEKKLYDFDEFLAKGAAGATPLRTLGSAGALDFFSV